ncbi:MAG TPA: RND family transporter [Thermoplasmatales archaeon]|nr:RND family transporter [Thermoplasmatales archaeon]
MTWKDYEKLMNTGNQTMPLPDVISTKDMEIQWINIDTAPDKKKSPQILFIKPTFFKELRINALSFLSKDYEKNKKPSASLIILQLNNIENYEETITVNNEIVKQITKLDEKKPYVSIEATGDGVITAQIHEVTDKANSIIGPSIFLIIMFILLISFRKLSYIVLPLLSLTISVIWVFGTMVLLGMPFNTMAVAVVPLLMGLGVDYSVHLSHTYRAELQKGKKPGEAMAVAVQEIGRAMFLAMLTTVIAFLSFLTATVPPIRNFGIILAFGILYTFINAITLQASIRYILDRKKTVKINKKKKISLRSSMEKLSKFVTKHQKTVLTTMIILSIIMGFGALQTKTGFDYKSFLPEDNPAMNVFNKIADNLPYASQDQEYILIEGNIATVKTLQGIKKTLENLDDDTFVARRADGTVKANSIYTLIQQATSANKTLIKKYNIEENTGIPKTNEDVKNLFNYLYNSNEYQMQTKTVLHKENNKYKATVIQIYIDPSISLDENTDLNKNIEILQQELNQDMENYGDAKAIATGSLLITHSITTSLTKSQTTSTILSFILAAFVLMITYKKPLLGLIAMIPVGVSIIWILGTMHFIGYTLNVLTITVTSLTIGMGIDYAIHATERFRLIADRTGDVNKAVCETISHTGGALLIAATTTAAGFGILIFAPIPPQVQFGVITAMTIIYAFITSILLLPLILIHWGNWRKKQKGYIISPGKPKD